MLGVVCSRCLVRNCCSRILFSLCHDISTGCAKNVLACHYAPSRATAACCQAAYSQQALHVFYNLIRGIEGMFVSSGFHRKFALPWVLLVSTVACLTLFGLLGRLHPAQAFAAHSSLNTTSTCGTNGMPHMCAIEVDAETTGNIDARRLRVRSSVPGIHGDSPFSPDVVDARRVFLFRRRRKHSSVSCNIRHLFAAYVRSRADAQEDENFLPGEISRVAVGRHCELFYSITLPLVDITHQHSTHNQHIAHISRTVLSTSVVVSVLIVSQRSCSSSGRTVLHGLHAYLWLKKKSTFTW